jgi:hypothetical protein
MNAAASGSLARRRADAMEMPPVQARRKAGGEDDGHRQHAARVSRQSGMARSGAKIAHHADSPY